MELMQEVKGYSDNREEEEEEEAREIITITRDENNSKHYYPFSSSSAANYTTTPHPRHIIIQNPWLGMLHEYHHNHGDSPDATTNTESDSCSPGLGLHQQDAASNFINQRKQIDFMDLSLGRSKEEEGNFQQGSGGGGSSSSSSTPVEKEHMFDKAVTPSDVGKLNRLVIPKQHAEKYFPLDSSSNEKGLLLNFEDRNGKLWRFRYSYWNSSQSYVMTKGWSRFVKEKKLDAGDIVSFHRGLGELYRHRLYIDWWRRPGPDPSSSLITPLFLPNQYSIRSWGGSRLYSLPSPPTSSSVPRHLMYPFHHHHPQYLGSGTPLNTYTELNSGSGSLYYLTSTPSMSIGDQKYLSGQQQERGTIAPMIIDSVPVAHHHHGGKTGSTTPTTSGKRLRLFGVNMECASTPAEESKCLPSVSAAHVTMPNSLPSSSLSPLQRFGVPHEEPLSSSARFGDQRGGTSVLFDLDPSLRYSR